MNHRTGLAIVLVSCVQVSAQQPATVSEITSRTTGTFVFNDPGSHHPITVWFCRPSSITADTRIVFVMHGSESKTASQACDIAAPEVEGLNAIVLAPEFSEKYYPQDAYTFGNMLDSRGTLVAKSEWALMSVERLFNVVRHALALPRPEYDIVGFSGGGQFVHRLVLFVPEAHFRRAVAASAGRYVFPSWAHRFPYGLEGSPIDRTGLTRAFSRNFILMLGDRDTSDREREPDAREQGTNRFARGLRFFATATEEASTLGVALQWQLRIVPGVDHAPVPMIRSALQLLR